jgi:hypothetical protein
MSVLTRDRRLASGEHDLDVDLGPGREPVVVLPSNRPVAPPPGPRARWGGHRYQLSYRHEGARSLLGICWFLLLTGALVLTGMQGDPAPVAALLGFVAALAGYQSVARWREVGVPANRLVAGAGALAMAFAALDSPGWAGTVAAGVVVLAVVDACFAGSFRQAVAAAGCTTVCGILPGFAAASLVFVADSEIYAAAALAAMLVFYDAGDYVNGGDHSPVEGPLWGIVSALIVTFVVAMWTIPPFGSPSSAWVFGGMAAALAPVGQLVGSALLPAASAPAPGLRRIDSLLLAGPVWAWSLWSYLGA